jgi:Predicted hydrolases or acyltransferases (alpha/beta hydrolase superfamily)
MFNRPHRGVLVVICVLALLATACSSGSNSAVDHTTTATSAPSGTIRLTTIRANGLTFNARDAGPETGRLVILLHGFPQSSYEWRSQLTALANAGYHAVAPDQRGYSPGARPTTDDQYTIDHMVADTVAIADHFHAKKFDLVGHDWGAGVAWATAIAHPERLRSLTAVSVPHPAAYAKASENPNGEQHNKKGYIDTFVKPGVAAGLANAGFFRAAFGASATDADITQYLLVLGTPDAMNAALAWYRANDLRTGLGAGSPAVTVPTLFVYGTADCCLGRDAADLTQDYVTGPYTYKVLDGASHWIPEAAAADLNDLLLAHLRSPREH